MDRLFCLTDIQNATGVTAQRLRYIIDQGLLPGWGGGSKGRRGRGSPRRFTALQAFGLTFMALLLKAGLRRNAIKHFMETLYVEISESETLDDIPLYQALKHPSILSLEIGDGSYFRLLETDVGPLNSFRFGWVNMETGARVEMYEPLVTIQIDVTRLRQVVKKLLK